MKINSQRIHQLVMASALASGLVSAGVAASAQTTDEATVTTQATTATAATSQTTMVPGMTTTTSATNVSLSHADSKIKGQADLERADADGRRRMLFRNQGMSL
jgi:hypothetical protein